jgi:hypothetical protein
MNQLHNREIVDFEEKIDAVTPVLFYSFRKGLDRLIKLGISNYAGIVLEICDFTPDNPDWQIRVLYHHCVVMKKPVKIISIVPEPISENIHAFFNHVEFTKDSAGLPSIDKLDELRDYFLENFDHKQVLRWFDTHIQPVFNIDVFDHPFPDSGTLMVAKDNVEILLVRHDVDIREIAGSILNFLGVSPIPGESLDRVVECEPCSVCDRLSDFVILPYQYIHDLTESRYFRHFFNDAIKEQIALKWCDFNRTHPLDILKKTLIHIDQPLPNLARHDLTKYLFWYVDIPRTSSSSVRVELGTRFGAAYGKRNLIEKNHATTSILANHIPARIMRKYTGELLWNRMFKFSLIRNPWDRMLSIYNYRIRIGNIPETLSFHDYIVELARSRGAGIFKYHGFYLSNSEYILGEQDEMLIDYVGKFETREEDLKKIAARIGCPELGNIKLQTGRINDLHYSHFYDDSTMRIIAELYAKDLENFNYTFEESD